MTYKEELEIELKGITEIMLEEDKVKLALEQEILDLAGGTMNNMDTLPICLQMIIVPLLAKATASSNRLMMYEDKIRRLEATINIL